MPDQRLEPGLAEIGKQQSVLSMIEHSCNMQAGCGKDSRAVHFVADAGSMGRIPGNRNNRATPARS